MPAKGVVMAIEYVKPPLTFQQQLDSLNRRGLFIDDDASALEQLSSISYYRLSAYWYPFRLRNSSGQVEYNFNLGSRFSDVVALYEFDRRLRLLVMDALERVEVAVRTRMTYHFGHTYGAFGHTDPINFHPSFNHFSWLSKLELEVERSSDEFIRHYQNKYTGFPSIPVWMLTEVMSFGSLSFFYKGLRNDTKNGVEDKKAVSIYFSLHHKRLGDWLHTLTYIRNICAHHSRLWNRELAIRPDRAKEPEWKPPLAPRQDRIFYVLLMLRYLLRPLSCSDEWASEVTGLLEPIASHENHRIAMGMPGDWKNHPVWK